MIIQLLQRALEYGDPKHIEVLFQVNEHWLSYLLYGDIEEYSHCHYVSKKQFYSDIRGCAAIKLIVYYKHPIIAKDPDVISPYYFKHQSRYNLCRVVIK